MIRQAILVVILVFTFLCSVSTICYGQEEVYEKHIKVAIRMMGHQILLNLGDSNTRVMPIEKEAEKYVLKLERQLQINPSVLVATIDSVVKKTAIASSYLVEVVEGESMQVVYSYEIGGFVKKDLIPCIDRILPKANYQVYFTILESKSAINSFYQQSATAVSASAPEAAQKNKTLSYIGGFSAVILLGLIGFMWNKKRSKNDNPNNVSLGIYQFNKVSMELSFQNKLVELSSKEAELLNLLLSSANSTVGREHMLKTVWGDEGNYIGRTLDVFISKLRKKLEADENLKIINVRGVGYKLVLKG